MAIGETEGGRVRAWILLRSESPADAARQCYDALGYKEGAEGDDSFVLVRADVVDYHYNIMISVDAETWAVLKEKLCEIQALAEARELAVVPVVEHVPYPPHNTDGFITYVEAGEYDDEGNVIVGRQRNSPGCNPWG